MFGIYMLLALYVATSYGINPYEIENFYYVENNKAQSLPFTNKILVECNDPEKLDVFIKKIKNLKQITSVKRNNGSGFLGCVLETNDRSSSLNLLNLLCRKYKEEGLNFYPIVVWKGMEVFPENIINIEMQPAVTKRLLERRLEKFTDVKFDIFNYNGNSCKLWVRPGKLPANVLVLANLMASDTLWFKSATVSFAHLNGMINASSAVYTEANANLGEPRRFEITVNIYDPNIIIRYDLLPPIFRPSVVSDEIMFSMQPPQFKEVEYDGYRRATITYPFIYFNLGQALFHSYAIPYEQNGEAKTYTAGFSNFNIDSALKGTTIDDIQAIDTSYLKLSLIPVVPVEESIKNIWYKRMQIFGIVYTVVNFIVVLLLVLKDLYLWLFTFNQNEHIEDIKIWNELLRLKNEIGIEGTIEFWHDYYRKIIIKLGKVLKRYYKINKPLSSEECTFDLSLKNTLKELEKVYQDSAVPDFNFLKSHLTTFCDKNIAAYVGK
jgi:hypothetical protein